MNEQNEHPDSPLPEMRGRVTRNSDLIDELLGRVADLEAEMARITTFADAMHGNSYSGGCRVRRPVFKLIRGDRDHPSIIAFDASAAVERAVAAHAGVHARILDIYKRGKVIQPAYAYAVIVLAVIGALVVPRIAVLVDPAASAAASATKHHVKRRRVTQDGGLVTGRYQISARQMGSGVGLYGTPYVYPDPKWHHPQPLPIGVYLLPPPLVLPLGRHHSPAPTISASSSPSPSVSPSTAPSTPAPSPTPSGTPGTSLAPSSTNENTPAPSLSS